MENYDKSHKGYKLPSEKKEFNIFLIQITLNYIKLSRELGASQMSHG